MKTNNLSLRTRRAAGFTLLELLISITILSLLATIILFGWGIATSAWQKANSRLSQDRKVLATHHLLQQQMASMVPYRARTERGGQEFFFQGEPQAARFLSLYSLTGRARSGLYLIEYQVTEQAGGTKQLLLNEFPLTSKEELGALITGAEASPRGRVLQFAPFKRGPQTVVLLEDLEECHFEYYSHRPPEPGVWTDQWTSFNEELPRSMTIRAVSSAETSGLTPVSITSAIRDFSLRSE